MNRDIKCQPAGNRGPFPFEYKDYEGSGLLRDRNRPSVLLVDDEVVILSHLEEVLEARGYEIAGKAASADDAIRKAESLKPDLVIMDIVMPGELDGIDACEHIQQNLDIPVVLLTAYGDKSYVSRAKIVSPYGYILKPYQNDQVLATVELALEKKQLDARLEQAFKTTGTKAKDRGMQLREIHHRIKNHLSMISSFLSMKSLEINDRECASALDDIKARVNTVAAIHDQLYRSDDLEHIDCREYIEGLLNSFDTSLVTNKFVRIETEIQQCFCSSDKAMLIGLIVSELVCNALKHAFTDQEEGVILVSLNVLDDNLELIVSDNGKGLPDTVDFKTPSTFGMGLIRALARRLKADMDLNTQAGATFKFRFRA